VSLDVCIGWLPSFNPLKGGDDLFFELVDDVSGEHPANQEMLEAPPSVVRERMRGLFVDVVSNHDDVMCECVV